MSKLMRKFIIGLSIIMGSIVFISLYINMNFIQRYFIHKEKLQVNRICDIIVDSSGNIDEIINKIENTSDVIIVYTREYENDDLLNERIKNAFLDKGISLKKFWIWDKDKQDAIRDGRKIRIYKQDEFDYSLLVEYLSFDNNFIAVAKIIPLASRTLKIINNVMIIIFSVATLVMFLLIYILVRRILKPLKYIGETAKDISNLNFKNIDIRTKDELDILIDSINDMSVKLKESHGQLEYKNKQMEELITNVSHDLKTPISLIKMYTRGIKDGIDDGTFLDTIILQNDRMEHLVKRLLDLEKIKHFEYKKELINISECLHQVLRDYRIQAESSNLVLDFDIEDYVIINSNIEVVNIIFSNLVSNAVKYASDGEIKIFLGHELFYIRNKVKNGSKVDVNRLWEPFYVGDESRNKNMSGTGIGLSIVKNIAEENGLICYCYLEDNIITFVVKF